MHPRRISRLRRALLRFEAGLDRRGAVDALNDHLLALRFLLEGEGPAGVGLPMRVAALAEGADDRDHAKLVVEQAISLERELWSGEPSRGEGRPGPVGDRRPGRGAAQDDPAPRRDGRDRHRFQGRRRRGAARRRAGVRRGLADRARNRHRMGLRRDRDRRDRRARGRGRHDRVRRARPRVRQRRRGDRRLARRSTLELEPEPEPVSAWDTDAEITADSGVESGAEPSRSGRARTAGRSAICR